MDENKDKRQDVAQTADADDGHRCTKWNSPWGIPGLLCLVVFGLDQWTKWLLESKVSDGWCHEVIPGLFNLVCIHNYGAAWGMFSEHTWALGCLSLVAFAGVFAFWKVLTNRQTFAAILYGMLAGGIVGNMVDRFFRKGVCDFLDFHWGIHHYPAFNVADSFICISVFLLVCSCFIDEYRKNRHSREK